MLPDGQLLTAYIISQENNTTVYSFPVMIYDEESSIRVEETVDSKGNTSYTTLGVWDSSDSRYSADTFTRSYLPLKAGTTIAPIYDVFNFENNTYETEYGEEYTISKSNEFEFLLGQLDDKEYFFAYEIEKYNETLNYSLLK